MDVLGELVARRDLAEQRAERAPLIRAERVDDIVLVGRADLPHLRHHLPAGIGETQFVVATVDEASLARDESFLLQVVDEGDNPARADPELSGEALLAHPGTRGDEAQDSDIAWLQVDRRETLGELRRRERTDLGQEESNPLRGTAKLGIRWRIVLGHVNTLAGAIILCYE